MGGSSTVEVVCLQEVRPPKKLKNVQTMQEDGEANNKPLSPLKAKTHHGV